MVEISTHKWGESTTCPECGEFVSAHWGQILECSCGWTVVEEN